YSGGEQYERVDAASVDRQVVDLFGRYKFRDATLILFHERRLGDNADFPVGTSDLKNDVEVDGLSDLDSEILWYRGSECLHGHRYGLPGSRHKHMYRDNTGFTAPHVAVDAFCIIRQRHHRARYYGAGGVMNGSRYGALTRGRLRECAGRTHESQQ